MQKRRDRIEKWRAERKKKQGLIPINIALPSKKWSLEDDDDDDEEEEKKDNTGADDEIDPLDAYMMVISTLIFSHSQIYLCACVLCCVYMCIYI